MQILAFLFFASVFGFALVMIRGTLMEASERIGLALAGDYRLSRRVEAPIYIARHRPTSRAYRVTSLPRRIAA